MGWLQKTMAQADISHSRMLHEAPRRGPAASPWSASSARPITLVLAGPLSQPIKSSSVLSGRTWGPKTPSAFLRGGSEENRWAIHKRDTSCARQVARVESCRRASRPARIGRSRGSPDILRSTSAQHDFQTRSVSERAAGPEVHRRASRHSPFQRGWLHSPLIPE